MSSFPTMVRDIRKRAHGLRRRRRMLAGSAQATLWMLRCLAIDGLCRECAESVEEHTVWLALGIKIDVRHTESTRTRRALMQVRERLAELEATVADRSHPVFANVEHLGELLGLDACARELLAFAVLCDDESVLDKCFCLLFGVADGAQELYAGLGVALGFDADAVRVALAADATLARAGLVQFSTRGPEGNKLHATELARQVLLEVHADAAALVARLVEEAPPAELTLPDFAHAAADVALLRNYLQVALRDRQTGVNVLLYGPPGTGKTQLTRVIAQELGATLYQVQVADKDGDALNRGDRFGSYQLCQVLLQDRAEALILFDEVEDAFPSAMMHLFDEKPARDKGWTNRLLEENRVPAFWLTNKAKEMDAAFLRRFDFVMELAVPPKRVRRQMLAKHLEGVAVDERWLDRCAADDDITPADIARAAKVALKLPTEQVQTSLERVLGNQLLVRRGPKPPAYRTGPVTYDLSCVNADLDVAALARALHKRPRANVCLYGPPGTGKTAFAAWLASDLDRPLVHKRASDLLDKYVGQTEKKIAEMFREAAQEGAVLLLDEADSFLRDRRGAQRSWEVTQVNELLVQMEAFDGLFLCATNLLDQLDEAAFRRFAFKVRFSALTEAQRVRMLRTTLLDLGAPAAESADMEVMAATLGGVTPGDFAAVARQYQALDRQPSVAELTEALRSELSFRTPGRRAAGFLA